MTRYWFELVKMVETMRCPYEVVERIVDRRRRNPETGGLVAVDFNEDREPLGRDVAGDVGKLRQLIESLSTSLGVHSASCAGRHPEG